MRFCIKEKNITEQELEQDEEELFFSQEELEARTAELDMKMHKIAVPLQEKVPAQVASEYFETYVSDKKLSSKDTKKALKIAMLADEEGLVRIADIFILAEIHNNIDLSWMLDKYKKG